MKKHKYIYVYIFWGFNVVTVFAACQIVGHKPEQGNGRLPSPRNCVFYVFSAEGSARDLWLTSDCTITLSLQDGLLVAFVFCVIRVANAGLSTMESWRPWLSLLTAFLHFLHTCFLRLNTYLPSKQFGGELILTHNAKLGYVCTFVIGHECKSMKKNFTNSVWHAPACQSNGLMSLNAHSFLRWGG